jgi:hypothetical protein
VIEDDEDIRWEGHDAYHLCCAKTTPESNPDFQGLEGLAMNLRDAHAGHTAPEKGQLLTQREVLERDDSMSTKSSPSVRSKTTSAASMRHPVVQSIRESSGEVDDQVLAIHA